MKAGAKKSDEQKLIDGPKKADEKKLKEISEKYAVVYWPFAKQTAHPSGNVALIDAFSKQNRSVLEAAFTRAIMAAVIALTNDQVPATYTLSMASDQPDSSIQALAEILNAFSKKIIFVADKASNLLLDATNDNVSFFRCLRSAMISFKEMHFETFFVVMATYPTVVSTFSPGLSEDPYLQFLVFNSKDVLVPLDPFLPMASFTLHNNRSVILAKKVEDCHDRSFLYCMGRPLWASLTQTWSKPPEPLEFCAEKTVNVKFGAETSRTLQ